MKQSKIIASAASVAAILSMAGVAVSANAAEAAKPTLTISATGSQKLTGHSFNAYYLGAYGNLQAGQDGNFTSATVSSDANATAWVQTAIDAVNGDKDDANNVTIKAGQDPVDALSRANGVAAHAVAEQLKSNADGRPAAVASDKTSNDQTLEVPSEGWYLVTDSAGMSLLVGTTSNGKTVVGQNGTVTLKSTTMSIHKQGDASSVSIGHYIGYTATAILPEAANVKKASLTDAMTGMVLDGDVTAKVGDEDVTAKVTITKADGNTGFTADLSGLLANYGGQTVTLTYRARITAATASNALTANWTDKDGNNGNTNANDNTVTATAHQFDLTKVDAGDTNAVLKGAGFKIQIENGKWQSYDAKTGQWSDAADEAHATEFTTGDNGKIAFPGLGSGAYVVKETKVPAGHFKTGDVTFKATIADNGTVTFEGTGANNGLTARVDDDSVQVKNLSNISQLPQTGAFGDWTIAVGTIALLAAAMGVGALAVRRGKLSHDVEAPAASI